VSVRSAVDLKEAHPSDHLQGEIADQKHIHFLGLDPKDIDIDITGDVLTLRGEKKTEEEKKEERYYCRERHYGSFQRSFRLPTGVQNDKVDAKFKNGILTIDMPKSEESKQKRSR